MKPTIGRIVHVRFKDQQFNGSNIAPAIITRVWSDTCINCQVFVDGPAPLWLTSVPLYDFDTAPPGSLVYWDWPKREETPGR